MIHDASSVLYKCMSSHNAALFFRLAVKVHKEALLATSAFWKALMRPEIRLETLAEAVANFDVCVRHADLMYKNMLTRHPDNWKMLRM